MKHLQRVLSLWLLLSALLIKAFVSQECNLALGMESGKIKDKQITALTWLYHDRAFTRYYRPPFSRLNYVQGGGSWCSEEHERYPGQYLEVDLEANVKITAIATQGRHGGSEWVDEYGIVYKRSNDTDYRQYTDDGRWKIFKGNNNTNTVVKRVFSHPIIARKIRIVPQGNEFNIYCMRLELYGCEWKKEHDGLLHYFSHLGAVMDNVLDLKDYGYDGTVYPRLGFETHGLGQLTDDVYGTKEVKKGTHSDWVGFNKNSAVISFTFQKQRNFHAIKLHIFNQAPSIKIFKAVEIYIGNEKNKFRHVKTYINHVQSSLEAGIFKLTIALKNVVGRVLKCKFTLGGDWMLISEVDFVSEPASYDNNVPTKKINSKTEEIGDSSSKNGIEKVGKETKSRVRTLWPKALTLPPELHRLNRIHQSKGIEESSEQDIAYRESSSSGSNPKGLSFPIIVAIVLGAIVIMVVMVVFIVRRIKHVQNRQRRKELQYGLENEPVPKPTDMLASNKIVVHSNGSAHYSAKLLDHGYYKDSIDRYSVDGKLQMI